MKKTIKTGVIITAVVIAAIVVLRLVMPYNKANVSWLSTRTYAGNRITIHLHITVDGEPAGMINNSELYHYKLIGKNDCYTISDRANEYDNYEYYLLITDKSNTIPLHITVNHWNWWEILESDLYIDIDTKNNTYTTSEKYGFSAESPVYHWETGEKTVQKHKLTGGIDIYAGNKG